jgi:hypothetical protein
MPQTYYCKKCGAVSTGKTHPTGAQFSKCDGKMVPNKS